VKNKKEEFFYNPNEKFTILEMYKYFQEQFSIEDTKIKIDIDIPIFENMETFFKMES
jgi:hypothetical protein